MAIAVTNKIAVMWSCQPEWPVGFPNVIRGQFINTSKFSDKVVKDVLNHYGVELDEYVKDLCYHMNDDGGMTLEVITNDVRNKEVSTFHRRR